MSVWQGVKPFQNFLHMTTAASRTELPPLYEQLVLLPANITSEIIGGVLHTRPRPSGRHGLAGSALNVRIGSPFGFGNSPGG